MFGVSDLQTKKSAVNTRIWAVYRSVRCGRAHPHPHPHAPAHTLTGGTVLQEPPYLAFVFVAVPRQLIWEIRFVRIAFGQPWILLGAIARARFVGRVMRCAAARAPGIAVVPALHDVIALPVVVVREWEFHPTDPAPLFDDGGIDRHVFAAIAEPDHVRLCRAKLKRGALETGFGERVCCRAEAELVAAAMVRRHLPPRTGKRPAPPHRAGRHRRQHLGPQITLLGILRRVVLAGIKPCDGRAARHPTRVVHRGNARCAPRVELVEVFFGPNCGVLVRCPVLGMQQLIGARLGPLNKRHTALI